MKQRPPIITVPTTVAALSLLVSCGGGDLPAPSNAGGGGAAGSALAGPAGSGGVAGSSVAGGGTAGLSNAGTAGAGGAAVGPTFGTLKGVIQTSCFGGICHDLPEHPLQLKLDDKLYTTLTTHVTKNCGPLMKPGSPQESALVKLLKGPCGDTARMPYGKCTDDGDEGCVSPANIALIEQWISMGAPP